MKITERWIGRFDVKPKIGNHVLGAAKGAIVNVVALATSSDDFIRLTEETMSDYGFDTLWYADIARLTDWVRNNKLAESLDRLTNNLTNEFPIQFDEFQTYRRDDA